MFESRSNQFFVHVIYLLGTYIYIAKQGIFSHGIHNETNDIFLSM